MNAFLTNITGADGAATDLRKIWGFFFTIRTAHEPSTPKNLAEGSLSPHPMGREIEGEGFQES